jgi:hypothetical protein
MLVYWKAERLEKVEKFSETTEPLGKIVEGDHEDLVGQKLNEKGEIVDEGGDVIGRAEVVPGEAADKLKESAAEAGGLVPDLSILEGKKVNKRVTFLTKKESKSAN